jgi:hypothetical protein
MAGLHQKILIVRIILFNVTLKNTRDFMAFLERIKKVLNKQSTRSEDVDDIDSAIPNKTHTILEEPIIGGRDLPDVFICRTCGEKFDTEIDLLKHKSNLVNQEIQSEPTTIENEIPEELLCKTCGRYFCTEYELLNHIHRPDDIIAARDPIFFPLPNDEVKPQIDTRFVYKDEVHVSTPKSELLRYEKFKGKIGYIPKK